MDTAVENGGFSGDFTEHLVRSHTGEGLFTAIGDDLGEHLYLVDDGEVRDAETAGNAFDCEEVKDGVDFILSKERLRPLGTDCDRAIVVVGDDLGVDAGHEVRCDGVEAHKTHSSQLWRN